MKKEKERRRREGRGREERERERGKEKAQHFGLAKGFRSCFNWLTSGSELDGKAGADLSGPDNRRRKREKKKKREKETHSWGGWTANLQP